MGSFRGGKRGGSRTAHLKAPTSEAAPAASAAAPKPSPWRTTRSRQPASRQTLPATASRQHRGDPGAASATNADEAEPIEDEEDAAEGVEPDPEADAEGLEQEDEEDEEISDMEAEQEEHSVAGIMHAGDSGELVFEVDVVNALASVPASQPKR